jgi:NADPH:quinone reductase-like Zn-dependent oxidoreductase
VLGRVAAVSLNRGEVLRAQRAEPGLVLGWDAAGMVVQAAASGRSPAPGTRVVTRGPAAAGTHRPRW